MTSNSGSTFLSRLSLTSGDLLFVGTSAIAMASALFDPDLIRGLNLVLFFAAGFIYLVLAVRYSKYVTRTGRHLALYLAVQTFLALAIVLLGKGNGVVSLVIAPLASHGVIFLGERKGYAFGILLALVNGLSFALLGVRALSDLVWITGAYGSAIVFTMITTHWNLHEYRVRAEVERLNEKLIVANQKLRELANQSAELAAAQERNRIAREIHDSLGHNLTTISIELDVAEQLIPKEPEKAAAIVQKARSLTRQGLADVRKSVAALRAGPQLDLPLPAAIQSLVDESDQTGLQVAFRVDGELFNLSYPAQLTLYRSAQEALTNIHKHSKACKAEISLSYSPTAVRLTVVDDGPSNEPQDGETGFGLIGLRERANQLGGRLEAGPRPEGGYQFLIEVPVH